MQKKTLFSILCIALFCRSISASWAEKTLASLSLREKIGQLFMVATGANLTMLEKSYATQVINSPYKLNHQYVETLIKEYHIGGITFLYKGTPSQQIDLTNTFQELSKLPLLIGQDCEYGLSMRLYDTIRFPHSLTLAAQGNLEVIYEIAYEIGKQCKAMGVHINFAPVVDINTNPDNPVIGDRSFGDNKEHVAACGVAFAQGLQDAGILACAKHFPGHGDTAQDSHLELPKVLRSKEELFEEDLYPFKALIDAGVACIMNAHLQVPALDKTRNLPTSLSKKVVTELLQNKLGFEGLVITDGMGMKAVTKHHKPGESALKALQAGNDIILCPVDVPAAVECIEQALLNGTLSQEELDCHVLKILQFKEQLSLHEERFVNKEYTLQALKNPDALALKQQAYQNAITLVNQNFGIPKLDESAVIVQVGGYLPSAFEKTMHTYNKVPIYHLTAEPQKETLEFVEKKLQEKNVIIVALFEMEKNSTNTYGIDQKTLAFINALQEQGKHVIIILFGTPYALELFGNQQQIIVAFEDDEDTQQAAAEIILSKRKPMGILPVKID